MFNKEHLEKMLTLNEEHSLATPERRKEIEQEICDMVPEDVKSNSVPVQQLAELQKTLKHQLTKLADCATEGDFDIFFKNLSELDGQIYTYAKTLGVDFPRTDYATMKQKMLELRFNNENK